MTNTSCAGCKYLYGDGTGYSNYTWMETYVRCALARNHELLSDHEEPWDWDPTGVKPDEWKPTKSARCDQYSTGKYITLDPEREGHPSDSSNDQEQIKAICDHANLPHRNA